MNKEVNFFERLSAMKNTIELMGERSFASKITAATGLVVDCLTTGKSVFICGNGGSAADAQHFAAELVGRFKLPNRRPLPAVALTVDTSALTAIANDFGYKQVFSRQLEALGNSGDVLICISTSGNSENVLHAVEKARDMGIRTIALTGVEGGAVGAVAEHVLNVPSAETDIIQQCHLIIEHFICQEVDNTCETEERSEDTAAG